MPTQPKMSAFSRAFLYFIALLPAVLHAQTPPTLVFPKNNIVTSSTNIAFQWDTVAGATSFDIQYDTTAALNVSSQNALVSSFSATLASNKKYYWRVRANTAGGSTGWSPVWSFTIFSPSDIPRVVPAVPNLVTWYKPDYGIHTDGTNTYVTQWDDASGQNNHAVQAMSGFQPLYINSSSVINGYPLVRFPGLKQYLDFTIRLNSVETVFWVIMEDPAATQLYRVLLGDWDNEPHFGRGCCTGGYPGPDKYIYDDLYPMANDYAMNGTTRVNGTIVDAIATNVPTTMSIISTKTTGNCQAENFSNDRNFIESGGRYRVWWGDLAELIIFNDPLTTAQISLVEEYLRNKYAPAVNLGKNIISKYKLCDTVTLSVGHYKTVTWWNGATTASVQVSAPGTYWVTVKDQFDRFTSDTIKVEFVRPQVIQSGSVCHGDSIVWNTGLGNDYAFEWQDDSTDSSYVIKETGDYWVKVTDSTGCVYQTSAVHITVDTFPMIADLGADTLICQGQSIGLASGANLASDYHWSTGETDPEISISTSGTYSLTVSNGHGCSAVDSIYVDVGANAPVSNFSAVTVCYGELTSFTDQSTIAPPNSIVSWLWSFGDGSTDTVPNATHAYGAPGTYAVTLKTTADNLCINVKTKTVKVHALPQPLFYDSVACVNMNVTFEDATTVEQGAAIANWFWNFGDNSAAIQQNPVHQFYSIDTFNVSLTVTDSRGCSSSYSRQVESVPSPALPPSPNLLLPLHEVTLSEPSVLLDWQPATGALYYSVQIATNASFTNIIRHFQDLESDSLVVTGLASGQKYYWRVRAHNMCGDYAPSGIRNFSLFTPDIMPGLCAWFSADRNVSNDLNGNVDTLFDGGSAGNNAIQSNALRRPELVLNVPELSGKPVMRFDGHDDFLKFNMISTIRTIFWVVKEDSNATPFYRSLLGTSPNGSQPDFTRGCCDDGYPGTQKYIYDNDYASTNVITGVTRLNGTVINPLQTDVPTRYSIISTKTNGDTRGDCFSCDRPFEYVNDQRYWHGDLAELIIFCEPLSDSLINVVEKYLKDKYAPPVYLGPDVILEYGLCAPTVLNAGDRFVSYQWSTGETTSSIEVNGPGTYWVVARDLFGNASYDEVSITGGLNMITFADTLNICLGDTVIWDTELGNDYSFQWQDGYSGSLYALHDTGYYWVTVTDSFNCSVTTDTVYVRIDSFSVQAKLGADTNLCSGNSISLLEGQGDAIQYHWNNGSAEPSIIVNQSGNYSVTVANANSCIAHDTVSVTIVGVAPNADFVFTDVCLNDTTLFRDQSNSPMLTSWTWNFGDGAAATSQNAAHVYQSPGTYNVKITVIDSIGCAQSAAKPVTIYPLPAASFYHDLVNCAKDEVHFFDTSTVAPGQTIVSWSWTLGDGDYVAERHPVHVYQEKGVYPVSIKVTTDKGCSSLAYKPVEVYPELAAGIRAENLCMDKTANFFDNSPGFSNVSWYWNFGDNIGYSYKENPAYNYPHAGMFIVSLRVANAIGCERTVTDTIIISSSPAVRFDTPDLCENGLFQFIDSSVLNHGDDVIAWQWSFGDGSQEMTIRNPVHAYDSAGLYPVSLAVRTEKGCESSATKTIAVLEPPLADFSFSPTYGAAPITVHFTNQSERASAYEWNFGDNSTSSEANPAHTYEQNATVDISLIASNLPGCSDTATKTFKIAAATVDIAIEKVIIEKSYNDDCSYVLTMGAYVQNVGTRDVTGFDIFASNSEGGTIIEHWEGEFNQRQVTYQFNADFQISDCEQDAVICMEVMNPNGENDINLQNNRSCVTLSSEPVIIGPYPNPAKEYVNLDIILPSSGHLRIYNYNASGNKLKMMTDGDRSKGYHRISMETGNLAPGVYMLRVEFKDYDRIVKYLIR